MRLCVQFLRKMTLFVEWLGCERGTKSKKVSPRQLAGNVILLNHFRKIATGSYSGYVAIVC